ncbi:MAG: nucleotide exchange factor GrpE [Pyrinomonadaceae bacterium]|nr:nucleotide exchange factor GrpE [Pyrinomonadaceae bacterium]
MSANNTPNEEQIEEVDASSVDDFIKELEEKEKDLDISSDLVIEVGESEVEHENIHDSFMSNSFEVPSFEDSLANVPVPSLDELDPEEAPEPQSGDEVEKLRTERDELKDSLVRRQRDFDNYRNRTERERGDTFKNVVVSVGNQMLPVLDNLNRALDASSSAEDSESEGDFQTFVHGIVLVNQQLNEVLASMGIKPIPAVNEPFDPRFHEAVATEETDEFPPKTVIEEILRGYQVDDRVIRPSMVKVSAPVSSGAKDQSDEQPTQKD